MRLRNKATGVVVNVADEDADKLSSDYEPASKSTAKKTAAPSSKSSTDK